MKNKTQLKLKDIYHGKLSTVTGRFMYREMTQSQLSKLNPIMVEEFSVFKEEDIDIVEQEEVVEKPKKARKKSEK